MFIKHYIYSYPYSLPDGTQVKEEYELWNGDKFVSIHYTNPNPTLPIEHIVDQPMAYSIYWLNIREFGTTKERQE